MMRFEVLTFQVPNIAAAKAFYVDVLGMHEMNDDSIGYSEDGLKLRFTKCDTERKTTSRDAYWKIGITVKNLDRAAAFLKEKKISCSSPSQFLDIGYLCHLRDPSGLVIELIQQGFEGKHTDSKHLKGHAIGGQATLAHFTIRVCDLEKAKTWCEDTQGMRLMSIQPVDLFGFTLYFYTWSDEEIPGDLRSKEIREWLWGRPYAMLELQHINGASFLRQLPPGSAGPTKLTCSDGQREVVIDCNKDLIL
jgi:catechol 2,3-dioxygenase-like lactoylglutathione lyase family enzyme